MPTRRASDQPQKHREGRVRDAHVGRAPSALAGRGRLPQARPGQGPDVRPRCGQGQLRLPESSVVTHLNYNAVSTFCSALVNRCPLKRDYTETTLEMPLGVTTRRPQPTSVLFTTAPAPGRSVFSEGRTAWWLGHPKTPGSVVPLRSFFLNCFQAFMWSLLSSRISC